MTLTADDLDIFSYVHGWCIKRFDYVSDQFQFGKVEHFVDKDTCAAFIAFEPIFGWRFKGDCDDFALLCRMMLRAYGFKPMLVVCETEAGELHMVCSVNGWIFDNRYRALKRRDDLPYKWLKISSAEAGGKWHEIHH